MAKEKEIDWKKFTSEEINLKKMEFNNTYQMLRNMVLEMIEQMEKIEREFDKANIELSNMGIS